MNYTNKFTENFNDIFFNSNMSKTKFAKEVGLKHSQIEHYLKGTMPIISNVIKICDYFKCSIDYLIGIDEEYAYKNMKTNFYPDAFYPEYQRLLNLNSKTHYYLAKKNIVCETRLSSWKKGFLPKFEVMIAIAFELGGSLDKMLGRI